jgi:glutathione S-transferase
VLIALYENETPFEPVIVDLSDTASRAAFQQVWPMAKFPVLRDDAARRTLPESTIIIEYLAQHHAGPVQLVPHDPEQALDARLYDRFFDHYVHEPMQRIVLDKLQPADGRDPGGVARAKAGLQIAYDFVESRMASRSWAIGDAFTLADCSASPALYYADRVCPIGEARPHTQRYLQRLLQRPAFARVMREAQPYMRDFPG